jgi:hypothetical protein
LLSADVREQLEQFSGEVALEASDDVLLREPVGGASLEVSDGRRVPPQSDDDGPVERSVGLAVPTPVESVSTARLA